MVGPGTTSHPPPERSPDMPTTGVKIIASLGLTLALIVAIAAIGLISPILAGLTAWLTTHPGLLAGLLFAVAFTFAVLDARERR